MAEDKKYFAWADDLQAHINETGNVHGLTAEQIGAATPDYVDEQIAAVSSTGIPKLQVYPLPLITATEGQTEFFIDLSTYAPSTDTVLVQKGNLWLNPNGDYLIIGQYVVLTEAVKEGTTIGIWVFKNVPVGEEGSVYGSVIAPNSIPLDRLAEDVATAEHTHTASDVGALAEIATYYPPGTNQSADDLLDSFALIPVSSSVNPELYAIVGGTFAYVLTLFYISKTATSRRMQIAYSYNSVTPKLAVRGYSSNGWLDWEEYATVTDLAKYLPLDGSIPMTGGLNLKGSILYNTENEGQLAVQRNNNAYFLLDSANYKTYTYGTHNVTCGTTDLTSGTSALATNSIYQKYE